MTARKPAGRKDTVRDPLAPHGIVWVARTERRFEPGDILAVSADAWRVRSIVAQFWQGAPASAGCITVRIVPFQVEAPQWAGSSRPPSDLWWFVGDHDDAHGEGWINDDGTFNDQWRRPADVIDAIAGVVPLPPEPAAVVRKLGDGLGQVTGGVIPDDTVLVIDPRNALKVTVGVRSVDGVVERVALYEVSRVAGEQLRQDRAELAMRTCWRGVSEALERGPVVADDGAVSSEGGVAVNPRVVIAISSRAGTLLGHDVGRSQLRIDDGAGIVEQASAAFSRALEQALEHPITLGSWETNIDRRI